ncbi:MAG TPA: T9SS type A sorting domain-containing protein [Ignavibacteria bacterium]|nr:T9SS type A sorting domain-containing protein [Ignavibacteria bacterium]
MKKYCLLITYNIFLSTLYATAFAQNLFQVAVGGSGSDIAYTIIQTDDGGYVAAGSTNSFGAGLNDIYIVKINSNGLLLWTKTFGGSGADNANCIIQTSDGGYIVAGSTNSFGAGLLDVMVLKINFTGNLEWFKVFGGEDIDFANSIIQTSDNSYIIAGETYSFGSGGEDMYIIKLDSGGNFVWNKAIGGFGDDRASCIVPTFDGGYAVAGRTTSYGAGFNDVFIMKLNESGLVMWSKTVGTSTGDAAFSIIQTNDSGFVLGGHTEPSQSQHYLLKFNAIGTLEWTRYIASSSGFITKVPVIQTPDGGYALAGFTTIGSSGNDIIILKFLENGTPQWFKKIGGTGSDIGCSLIPITSGGFALAGYTSSYGSGGNDIFITKLDYNLNTCGNITFLSISSGSWGSVSSPTPIVTIPTLTITSHTPIIGSGGTLTSICNIVNISSQEIKAPNEFTLLQNYPNPFNPSTVIKFQIPNNEFVSLKIYDMLGHEVETLINEHLTSGTYEVEWNAEDYSSGIYFCKLQAEEYVEIKKMILMK